MTFPFKYNLPKVRCRVCREWFQAKRINSVLCSPVCRSINRRESEIDRNDKIRKANLAKIKKIKCRVCEKKFAPVPCTRVTCSHKCSKTYRPVKKKGLPRSRKLNPDTAFGGFSFGENLDSSQKKAEHRVEVVAAMKEFLDRGGKIEITPPLPSPKVPSVGSVEWSWEMRAGVGPFYSAQELSEPDYILEDIILNKK